MEGRPGHVPQGHLSTYDPITNQWLQAPPGTLAQTAGDRSRQQERDWLENKTGQPLDMASLRTCRYLSSELWRQGNNSVHVVI